MLYQTNKEGLINMIRAEFKNLGENKKNVIVYGVEYELEVPTLCVLLKNAIKDLSPVESWRYYDSGATYTYDSQTEDTIIYKKLV